MYAEKTAAANCRLVELSGSCRLSLRDPGVVVASQTLPCVCRHLQLWLSQDGHLGRRFGGQRLGRFPAEVIRAFDSEMGVKEGSRVEIVGAPWFGLSSSIGARFHR